MTTVVYTQDVSVFYKRRIVGALSPNLLFKNTSGYSLDTILYLCLVKNPGEETETETNLQVWVNNDVGYGKYLNISGMYFMSDANTNLIMEDLNGSQTLRLVLKVTGGQSDEDRAKLVKQTVTDMVDYSVMAGKV